jgi:hypothetical protein
MKCLFGKRAENSGSPVVFVKRRFYYEPSLPVFADAIHDAESLWPMPPEARSGALLCPTR